MGETSKIEWTEATFSPWRGCMKVSEGCHHCYAEFLVVKRQGLPVWGANAERKVAAESTWRNLPKWERLAQTLPDRCSKCGERMLLAAFAFTERCPAVDEDGKTCGGEVLRNEPIRVFPSLCDIFEEYKGPDHAAVAAARLRYFRECEKTPHLRHLLLTKRPENVLRMVHEMGWTQNQGKEWPRNVWVGCTVENKQRALERLPHLVSIPAPVRFISQEPQLERFTYGVDMEATANRLGLFECPKCRGWGTIVRGVPDQHGNEAERECRWCRGSGSAVDWVIIGGESGHNARPFNPAWADQTRLECQAAGVQVFIKQMGSNPTLRDGSGWGPIRDRKGGNMLEWPAQLRVREVPAL